MNILGIAASIIVLIVIIAFIQIYPLLWMHPAATGRIENTDIYAIKDRIGACYLIKAGTEFILIDAGSQVGQIRAVLKEKEIPLAAVKHIFLTHSDADHTGAVTLFPNAAIYLGKEEITMIDNSLEKGKRNNRSNLKDLEPEKITLLQDGWKQQIGGHMLQVISTPGHTTGTLTYLIDNQFLFTGDCFRVKKNGMLIHPFTRDKDLAVDSMKKLNKIIPRTKLVFTTHYGYYKAEDLELLFTD